MQPYDDRLRKAILHDALYGKNPNGKKLSETQVAEKWEVSRAWVQNLKKAYRETGTHERPKIIKQKTGPKRKLAGHEETLRKIVTQNPDATLFEIQAKLPVRVSHQTVAVELKKLYQTDIASDIEKRGHCGCGQFIAA